VRQASNFVSLKVLEHAAAMALASWDDLYDSEGRPLRGDELTRETRMATQAIRRPRKGSASKTPFVGTPYRLYPKIASLNLYAQLVGLIPPRAGRPRGPGTKLVKRPRRG
jgi:hypothetical protein